MIDMKSRRAAIATRVLRRRQGASAPSENSDRAIKRAREGEFDPARASSNGTMMDVNLEEVAGCIANAWPSGER